MLAVNLASLTHETGHVLAARLAGQVVRAVVLAPAGSFSVRSIATTAKADLQTALAGSLLNAACGLVFAMAARSAPPGTLLADSLCLAGVLQILTGLANLLPVSPMDGAHAMQAWRALRSSAC
jgi:Zn-dependent protease